MYEPRFSDLIQEIVALKFADAKTPQGVHAIFSELLTEQSPIAWLWITGGIGLPRR
jgi:hypothetical protein